MRVKSVLKVWFLNSMIVLFSMVLLASCALSVSQDNASRFGKTPGAIQGTAAGNFNYGEALQKAILFYEFQRSGKLPANTRNNWRGDSGLNDGADVGVDLTGGWYDAGDHVKFNLPMAYTVTMLSWSIYENQAAFQNSGQLTILLDNIKWATDYLIKCHTGPNEYYYQVGDAVADHAWWGPAEVMQMARPSFKVTTAAPGSTVVGETAAALAAASIIFKSSDAAYSATCLQHAKDLFAFADATKSDLGYKEADTYYKSWSGWWDELSWAAVWLYLATGDTNWVTKAESYVPHWGTEPQTTTIAYKWGHCWDDVHYGAELLLAKITGKPLYKSAIEMNLDFWTTGYQGNRIDYSPKGLACLAQWGSIRYSTTQAFIASVYANWDGADTTKASTYKAFAKSQIDYALGSTGTSYMIGFGNVYPQHLHHRTAQGSWADAQLVPNYMRHILVGALVGGPDKNDEFVDTVANYYQTEPACDYNGGLVGALSMMYDQYGGDPIPNLKAIETPSNDEFFVEACVNATGLNFLEIKALMNNKSGWPARMGDKLSFKYFIDISEFVAKGYSASDFTTSVNYNQGGAKVTGLHPWNTAKNIYYILVDFTGVKIYPGGQSAYKCEIQFRIAGPAGVAWDSSNDWSFKNINTTAGGTPYQTAFIPVYDNGILVYGQESSDQVIISSSTVSSLVSSSTSSAVSSISSRRSSVSSVTSISSSVSSASSVSLSSASSASYSQGPTSVKILTYQNGAVIQNQMSGKMTVVNSGNSALLLSTVKIRYYIANQGSTQYSFHCDYSPIGSANVTGTFAPVIPAKPGAESYCEIGFLSGAGSLAPGASVEAQYRIWKNDWSNIDNSLNYSYNPAIAYVEWNKVTAFSSGTLAWGIEPNGSASSISSVSSSSIVSSKSSSSSVSTSSRVSSSSLAVSSSSSSSVVVSSVSSSVSSTTSVIGSIKVQAYNGSTAVSGNQLYIRLNVVNTGTVDIALSTVKVRYYYTQEGQQAQQFWCDWSPAGTVNVTSIFGVVSPAKTTADTYLEVGFTTAAGKLSPGASLEVQARVAKNDWSMYNQANDYSFNPTATAYMDWNKVTATVNGTLQWGVIP